MLIDTHAHLDFPKFDEDLDEVLTRAQDAGVGKIINITSSRNDFDKIRGIVMSRDQIWQSAGIHPHDTSVLQNRNWQQELFEYSSYKKVVAIGEIGLDYYEMKNTKQEQKKLFVPQLEIAAEQDLPVILHVRDAFDDVYELVQDKKLRGVVHCFSGSLEQARKYLDLGFLISFTNIITFPKTDELAEVVKEIPLEKIMIETDAPFLAPQRIRGERCEPAHVKDVAEKIADLREVSFDKVAKQTTTNAEKFFQI